MPMKMLLPFSWYLDFEQEQAIGAEIPQSVLLTPGSAFLQIMTSEIRGLGEKRHIGAHCGLCCIRIHPRCFLEVSRVF